ncbi:hypothetical protein L602_006100000010, partial [Cupriavidus gilardii J11]
MPNPVCGRGSSAVVPCLFQRRLYRVNTGLYLGWHTIAVAKVATFGATIAAFYRESRGVLVGLDKSAITCSLLGSVAAAAEVAITAVVFARTARKADKLGAKCVRHARSHRLLLEYCEQQKGKRKRVAYAVPIALTEPCGRGYAKYEAAFTQRQSAMTELSAMSVVFARDTVIQGAGAGANLALLWNALKLSDVLHVARCAIHVKAATLAAGAAGIACGVFHMVGGAIAVLRGNRTIRRATDKLESIGRRLRGRVLDSPDVGEAVSVFAAGMSARKTQRTEKYEALALKCDGKQFGKAIAISQQLHQYARNGEERALESARHQVRLGKLRIGYGAVSAAVGGAALAVALTVGAATPIGWAIAGVGALFAAGWLLYAWHRNKQYAKTLESFEEDHLHLAASADEVVCAALQALDGDRDGSRPDRMARKLIKQTLLAVGVTPEDFRVLKLCRAEDEADVRQAL